MDDSVVKVEHIWSKDNDRWMYLEYNEKAKVVGMNFMQGNEYLHFQQCWCENNEHMFEFYKEMLNTFPIECASVDKIEFINKCMWAFYSSSSLHEKYSKS